MSIALFEGGPASSFKKMVKCTLRKVRKSLEEASLQYIYNYSNAIPVNCPWFHVGLDFVGPIPPASSRGRVEATALPTKEAPHASTLFEV